jgi:hypothetical protein
MMEENEDLRDTPYNRLKTMMQADTKPQLTNKGSDNINKLFDIKVVPSFWDKVKVRLSKIDNWIFPKRKITNIYNKRK